MPEDNQDEQKTVGPFDDFEACVAHFDSDEAVDDPEALCGWMEENGQKQAVQEYAPDEGDVESLVEAMKDPNATSVLTDLEVTYVSGVENPAQDSQWVMAKDTAERAEDWGVSSPFVIPEAISKDDDEGDDGETVADEAEQQKAWAPVLIPNETDKQGDVIPPDSVEKAAHEFLAEYRNIDTDHDLLEGKGTPIENWTLKEDRAFTLPDGSESREYPAGTWMLGVKFTDEAWERVKSGELSGFSIYGEAQAHDVEEILGDGVDLEMGATTRHALADEADTVELDADSQTEKTDSPDSAMTDKEDEADEEKQEEEAPDEADEAEQEQSVKELVEDLQETAESTQETVESTKKTVEDHSDRLEALEAEVFEKEDEAEEAEESEEKADEDQPDPEEAAVKAVKEMFGLESEDLPEDPGERQEVVRKHIHEETEKDSGLGSPDTWESEDLSEVIK